MNPDFIQATIMIVDDEPENLNVLGETLSRVGWEVRAFLRGDMAISAARLDPPDLVLLDIRMPGMSGYDVCRQFKSNGLLNSIPIIFISALSAPEDIATGFVSGGVDYIAKPLRESEVLARVRTHIALRSAYTRLAEKHDRLMMLERHRDMLTNMMVHDMRSPLQVIRGHLEMIAGGGLDNLHADIHNSLVTAIEGTRVLSQMISTVVDLSRLESGSIPLRQADYSVHEILQLVRRQSLDPANSSRTVEVISSPCPALYCDADLTQRIIGNLISNALKYSPATGDIVLAVTPAPGGVRISVRDQGPGIPEQYNERIFEKFEMLGAQPANHPPSCGLGLAFCKLAVEAQGGRIGLVSKVGHGSEFWFVLPAAGAATSLESACDEVCVD